jgi:hypothetical protein
MSFCFGFFLQVVSESDINDCKYLNDNVYVFDFFSPALLNFHCLKSSLLFEYHQIHPKHISKPRKQIKSLNMYGGKQLISG